MVDSDDRSPNGVGQQQHDTTPTTTPTALEMIQRGTDEKGFTGDSERAKNTNDDNDDGEDNDDGGCFSKFVEKVEGSIHGMLSKYSGRTKLATYFTLLIGYFAYFIYCMQYRFGDEGSLVLLVFTVILVWKLLFVFLNYKKVKVGFPDSWKTFMATRRGKRVRRIVRLVLYLGAAIGIILYLGLEVFAKNPANLQSFVGMFVLIGVSFIFSAKPSKVNWHPVFWSFIIQFAVATLTLRSSFGYHMFRWIGDKIQVIFAFSETGSRFVLGKDFAQMGLAFSASGIIIFTNALVFLLNHLGAIEFVVVKLGSFFAFCLETGPVESVVAAANIFLGLSESSLLVRPYLATITKSELHTVMTCGFASISGGIMALFISIGAPANHLITAAVISAPCALAFSKLVYPETEKVSFETQSNLRMRDDKAKKESNSLSAFSEGAVMSLVLVAAIWSNMLAFLSIFDLLNNLINFLGHRAGIEGLTFDLICSYVLFPLAYAMGVEAADCQMVGYLIGLKMIATPVISYQTLGNIIENRATFEEYLLTNPNGTWHWEGSDIFLEATNETLIKGIMSERSEAISTYAMCGFSAFPAIGICLGALIPLCPKRKGDITSIILRAFLAGNMASFATGAISGVLFSPGSV